VVGRGGKALGREGFQRGSTWDLRESGVTFSREALASFSEMQKLALKLKERVRDSTCFRGGA